MNGSEKRLYKIAAAAVGSRKLTTYLPPFGKSVDAVVCDECNGAGLIKVLVPSSYLAQVYGVEYCGKCKGNGVVLDTDKK